MTAACTPSLSRTARWTTTPPRPCIGAWSRKAAGREASAWTRTTRFPAPPAPILCAWTARRQAARPAWERPTTAFGAFPCGPIPATEPRCMPKPRRATPGLSRLPCKAPTAAGCMPRLPCPRLARIGSSTRCNSPRLTRPCPAPIGWRYGPRAREQSG